MSAWGFRVWFATMIASALVVCGSAFAVAAPLRALPSAQPARQPVVVPERTLQQTVAVTLTKSLGLTPETACSGRTYAEITSGSTVYYCYTLTNSRATALEPLTLLDGTNVVNWLPPAPGYLLNPGETLAPTLANGLIRPVAVGSTNITEEVAEWNVDPRTGTVIEQVRSNATTIQVLDPASLKTTVMLSAGIDRNACPNSATVTVANYATTVYYCVTLSNASPISLTNHLISVPALNLLNLPIALVLAPTGQATSTLRITNTVPALNLAIPQLAQALTTPSLVAVATVTSTNATGDVTLVSTSASPLTVTGPGATITLGKTMSNDPTACTNQALLNANFGDRIYYCLVVTNTSSFNLTDHTFFEPALNIRGSFQTILPPGQKLTLTNGTLPGYGVAPVLGPFVANQSFNNTMSFTATNPALSQLAAASAPGSVNVVPPTATPTDEPTPTFTSEPFDTATPTPSLTPFPPTATWTPTWTPSPTFTPSPTVLAFTTPGGVPATPYPSLAQVGQGQPPGQFSSPLDPFAATATANALFGFPTPIIDPFAATATANALFGFPTPIIEPFAATATANALFGFPTPVIDPVGATATANALFGFPTPIVDPFAATATAAALFGFPAPVMDPFAATATAAALLAAQPTSPLATLAPEIAILPPSNVITVTATPTVDLSATPTQRPLAAPASAAGASGSQELFGEIVDSAGLTIALLWFLGGSILLFLVMGVLAGLSIRPETQGPFSLTDREDAGFVAEPSITKPESDDQWPDSLP